MDYIITANGSEQQMPLEQLRERFTTGEIQPSTPTRALRQDFTYPISKLFTQSPQMISFLCVNCRKPVPARWVDMQLTTNCFFCKQHLIIPDKRSDQEKASTQTLKMTMGAAWGNIIGGALLLLVLLLSFIAPVFLQGPGSQPEIQIGGLHALLGVGGSTMLTKGILARSKRLAEARRTSAPKS
jgi:hypothetical protein